MAQSSRGFAAALDAEGKSAGGEDSQLGRTTERVWTVKELDILNELCKPIVVVASSIYDSPHTALGLQSQHKVIFQNAACTKQYGCPRSQEDHDRYLSTCPETLHAERRRWLSGVGMSKEVRQVRMDLRALIAPLFHGLSKDSPVCMAGVESKPIQVETSPGKVEMAIMHAAELEQTTQTDQHCVAMLHRFPMHAMLFSSTGSLIHGNNAAMSKVHVLEAAAGQSSETHDLTHIFLYGEYPGGQEEALGHHEDALRAIFELQLDCHRHIQPYRSTKDGKVKWASVDMWPMPDPVDGSPAVLVVRSNITQEKQMEQALAASQESLQRHNQELEEESVVIQQEKLQLQQEALSLSQRLEAVLSGKFGPRTGSFDSDTPIDKAQAFLQDVIKGGTPSKQEALDLSALLNDANTNLHQPVGLEQQLLQHLSLDEEVGQSMVQLLQGSSMSSSISEYDLFSTDLAASQRLPSQGSSVGCTAELIPMPITPVIERWLQEADNNWQFDIFGFAAATPGITLSLLTFYFLKQTGVIEQWDHDETKLCRYLQRVEAGYRPSNPYHNSIHVAAVVQMTHMLLRHGGILKSGAMGQLEHWASIWSAAVHDYEHGGLNNDFLCKTQHHLAITYNDQSPLENHHLAAASRLLSDPELAYLPVRNPAFAERRSLKRSVSVPQVLGTDMKKHFDILSRFQAAFKRPLDASGATAQAWDWQSVKPEDKTLVNQMVLKCADIGHLAAAPCTHKRWAYQLEEEFFRQGDRERSCGLPLSPLMDRSTQGGMTRSQMGFFSIVGIPLFKAMAELFEESKPMLDGVLANYRVWEAGTPDADLLP